MFRLLKDRSTELGEATLVLPVLLLIALALINMAMLGFVAVNTGNTANYGAHTDIINHPGDLKRSNPSALPMPGE